MSRIDRERIEELAALLEGAAEDEGTSEARQLHALATAVRDHTTVERPTPGFRAELRAQLVDEINTANVTLLDRVRDAVWDRTARIRHSAKLATASATASLMIGAAGTAVAAQAAVPGDLLYPVKQATEQVRIAFASGAEETGRLHLALAEERLDELANGLHRMTPDQVIDALKDMDEQSTRGFDELIGAFDRSRAAQLLAELKAFAGQQRARLSEVVDELPLEAKPFADRSLELLRRIDVQAAITQRDCDCRSDGDGSGSGGSSRLVGPGEGPASGDCECVGPDGEGRQDSSGSTATDGQGQSGSDGPSSDADSADRTDRTTDGADADGEEPDDEGSIDTSNPLDDLTEPVDDVTDELPGGPSDIATEDVGGILP